MMFFPFENPKIHSAEPKFHLPGAVSSLAPWTDPYLIFLMAAISWCELWSVCAALLRLGELNLPGLQRSEISAYYLNISPYLYFTQKCQIQLWLKHSGKWGVPVCSGLCQQKDQGNDVSVRSIFSISEFQLCTSKCLESLEFYSSKITSGCKWPGRFCYCWCYYCTQHLPCLRAWFWPLPPGWDQASCSQLFQLLLRCPWLLSVQGSPAQGSQSKNTTWYHYWANSATSSHAKYL